MPSLPNVLASVPGYGGYLARRGQIEDQQATEQSQAISQAGALQKIYAGQEAERQAKELQGIVSQAGGTPAKAIEALLRAGTPQSIALAAKLKGLMPDPVKPELVTVVGPDGKPVQRWVRPGETKGVDVGPKYEKPAANVGAWSEPYQLGGATVQKNKETGEIRTAVARPPAPSENAAPVTPVTIQDPNDPTGASTIVIDGRTKQVLGKGPKLTQTGTADAKLVAAMPQAKLRVASMIQGIDRLDSAMAALDADPGLTQITGTLYGRTPNITNAATGAQAKLDSIKSQIFQSSLLAMREASKTGGAVGNVSDREGDKLERTIAALDQAQGTPAFKEQLKKARAQLKLSKALIQKAYDEQFGGVQQTPQRRASDGPGAPRVVDW